MGPARPPGLARRGTRAWQVGKEPTRAAPGTRPSLTVSGGAAGARSERPVSTNHVIRPTTRAGPAGWPGISARTARLSRTAAAARRARRSGRPWRMRSGSSSSGRMLGGGRPSQPGGTGRERGGVLEVLDDVGPGFAASPGGAQFGVGGAGLGVAGQVPAVGPVRVGRGGDLRARRRGSARRSGRGRWAGRARRTDYVGSWGGSGSEQVIKAGGLGLGSGGKGCGPGTAVAGTGAPMRVSGEGRGRATWT